MMTSYMRVMVFRAASALPRAGTAGCAGDSCLSEIAGAMGAQYVLVTRVSKLGSSYVVSVIDIPHLAEPFSPAGRRRPS